MDSFSRWVRGTKKGIIIKKVRKREKKGKIIKNGFNLTN